MDYIPHNAMHQEAGRPEALTRKHLKIIVCKNIYIYMMVLEGSSLHRFLILLTITDYVTPSTVSWTLLKTIVQMFQ